MIDSNLVLLIWLCTQVVRHEW